MWSWNRRNGMAADHLECPRTVATPGKHVTVTPRWPHRLVRCEVDLGAGSMAFNALRRRDPISNPVAGRPVCAAAFGSRIRPVRGVQPP